MYTYLYTKGTRLYATYWYIKTVIDLMRDSCLRLPRYDISPEEADVLLQHCVPAPPTLPSVLS